MRFLNWFALVRVAGVLVLLGCTEGPKYRPADGGVDVGTGGTTGTSHGAGGTGIGTGGSAIAGDSGGTVGTSGSGGMPVLGTGGAVTGSNSGGTVGTSGSGGVPSQGSDHPITCSANEKSCGGICVAVSDPKYGCGPLSCSASACPTVPTGATLACQADQCVVGTCGAGSKNCDGRCVPVTDPAYGCGASTCDASTCPTPGAGGTITCQGGECVIATCPTSFKKCGNKCVAISDPTYGCGATTCDANSCPAAGTGTLTCQGNACVLGSCGPGTKKCGDKCVTTDATNGCADPAKCTACGSNEACMGTPATCQCVPTPMATACNGKCGQVSNGCGGTYSCAMTCTAPQSCVSNACMCAKTPMETACTGKACGTASDGCGGTYPCGTCGGSTPDCVTNKCFECGNDTTCNSNGYYKCSSNKCVCRSESSDNLLKNAGFDGNSVSWNTSGGAPSYSSMDSEACPKSGSMAILSDTGLFEQCITTGFSAGREYKFGFRFKGNGEGRCIVRSLDGTGCTGQIISDPGGDLETTAVSGGDWASASPIIATLPTTTSSVLVRCTGQPANGYFDELYFTQTLGGGGRF